MKTILSLTLFICTPAASAQNYAITSARIASGGGTSSGTGAAGAFAVTGTIGQADASLTLLTGTSGSGTNYSIAGGFFSQYVALQQIGAPQLMIRRGSGGMMQVTWGSNVPGWVLQFNHTGLGPNGWIDLFGPPTVDGAEQFHQFVNSGGKMFFRLRKP